MAERWKAPNSKAQALQILVWLGEDLTDHPVPPPDGAGTFPGPGSSEPMQPRAVSQAIPHGTDLFPLSPSCFMLLFKS